MNVIRVISFVVRVILFPFESVKGTMDDDEFPWSSNAPSSIFEQSARRNSPRRLNREKENTIPLVLNIVNDKRRARIEKLNYRMILRIIIQ